MSTITQIGDDGFYPSDDKMVDVWLALHETMKHREICEETIGNVEILYFKLTALLLEHTEDLTHSKHSTEQ